MNKLIKAKIFKCDLIPYHQYHNSPNENKSNGEFEDFILKTDIEKIRKSFIASHDCVNAEDQDKFKSALLTEEAFDENEAIRIANPTFIHESLPYYTNCLMLEKMKDESLVIYFLKATKESSITKKRKDFIEKIQSFDSIVQNSYLKHYTNIKYKFIVLDDIKDEIKIIDFANTDEDNNIIRKSYFIKKEQKQFDKDGYVLIERIGLPIIEDKFDYSDCINRGCAKCDYKSSCALANKPDFMITDLYGTDYSRIDKYIADFKTFDASKLERAKEVLDKKPKDSYKYIDYYNAVSKAIYYINKHNVDYYIDKTEVKNFLKQLNKRRIQHIDFETIMSAFKQDRYNKLLQIPFSYSMHVTDDENNVVSETFFIVYPRDNDFDSIVEHMVKNIDSDAPIVVYNKSFERDRFLEIAELYPQHERFFKMLCEQIIDLWDVFNKGWCYHKDMSGTGLKTVHKALTGSNIYDEMEIGKGDMASAIYKEMFINNHYDKQKIEDLEKYNKQDTLSQVQAIDVLKRLVEE
jgi:hypothetical protein